MKIHECLLLFAARADCKYKGGMIEMARWLLHLRGLFVGKILFMEHLISIGVIEAKTLKIG